MKKEGALNFFFFKNVRYRLKKETKKRNETLVDISRKWMIEE